MERKFTFDDMKFVARSESLDDGALQVSIYDAWDECLLTADYPAAAPGAKPAPKKRKGAAPSEEEQAITNLIDQFQQKVEDGEIDLA